MAEKVFLEDGHIKLISDDRDFMMPMPLAEEILAWCKNNGVVAERVQHHVIIQCMFRVILWRVKDEQQRALFALRWA